MREEFVETRIRTENEKTIELCWVVASLILNHQAFTFIHFRHTSQRVDFMKCGFTCTDLPAGQFDENNAGSAGQRVQQVLVGEGYFETCKRNCTSKPVWLIEVT